MRPAMDSETKLTVEQLRVLRQYEDTDDGRFMQGTPGADDLWHKHGLLQWRGDQYGSHFYSITEAGRAALSRATQPQDTAGPAGTRATRLSARSAAAPA